MSAPAHSAELTRSFRRGFAVTFGIDLVTKVITALTAIVLIRGLAVESYAYLTLFLTIALFAGSATGGGVRIGYVREEAERLSRGGADSEEDAFLFSLFKGTALILGLGLCAFPVVWIIGVDLAATARLVVSATAFAAGYSAIEMAIARYQTKRRFRAAGVVTVARAIALLGAAATIVLTHQSRNLLSLWLALAITIVAIAATGPIVRKGVSASWLRARAWFARDDVWLSLYYVAAAGFAEVDVMVAAALLSDDQVATLGASLRYLNMVGSPIPAIAAILRIRTSQIDVVDSEASQRAMVTTWMRRSALPAGLLIGMSALLAPLVIPLIDDGKYPDSVLVLQIFLAMAYAAYLTAPAVSILMTRRAYTVLLAIFGIGLVLNFLGDLLVARPFGVVGIAVVSTSVYVGISAALTLVALRPPPPEPRADTSVA